MYTYNEIAGMIDHSLLKPFLTEEEVKEGCEIADKYRVASVCVRPCDVRPAKEFLQKSTVLVTTVIGFPHGSNTINTKLDEAIEAIKNEAAELDVVLNISKLKSGNFNYVKEELSQIIAFAHSNSVKVKVIFENCYLADEEIIKACEICNETGADWAKTSTGYGSGGAEDKHLILMRKHCKPNVQIKAAGGIRTLNRFLEIKKLGCTRIGTTATAEILDDMKTYFL
jgi:deoxyribose-phosphate aldolase